MEIALSQEFRSISEEEREQRIRENQEELERRKKEGLIDPDDYDLNYLYNLCIHDLVVVRRDLKRFAQHTSGQAINIRQEDLSRIKRLTGNNLRIMLADGAVCEIDPETIGYKESDRIIIFPEELGDPPSPEKGS